jgi:hypothetical protein
MTRKSPATQENLRIQEAGLSEEAMAMKMRTLAAQLALQRSIAESQVNPDEVEEIIKQRIDNQEEDYSKLPPSKLTPELQRFLANRENKKVNPK